MTTLRLLQSQQHHHQLHLLFSSCSDSDSEPHRSPPSSLSQRSPAGGIQKSSSVSLFSLEDFLTSDITSSIPLSLLFSFFILSFFAPSALFDTCDFSSSISLTLFFLFFFFFIILSFFPPSALFDSCKLSPPSNP
uniref:Uncharacterized protein n=1 Tax=Glycine max TaxID=3847 RepID=C6TN78_SOYBN|nr:unknown [Glycine max]